MSLKDFKGGIRSDRSQPSDGNNNFNKVNKPREFTGNGALNSKEMCVSYPYQNQNYLQSYRILYQSFQS